MRNKPKLIIIEEQKREDWYQRWTALTWEQRRRMTAAELKAAMGPLHRHHPDHRPSEQRHERLLPLPNLVGVNGYVLERHDPRVWRQLRTILSWALR